MRASLMRLRCRAAGPRAGRGTARASGEPDLGAGWAGGRRERGELVEARRLEVGQIKPWQVPRHPGLHRHPDARRDRPVCDLDELPANPGRVNQEIHRPRPSYRPCVADRADIPSGLVHHANVRLAHLYAIVRHDAFHAPDTPPQHTITVTKVFADPDQANQEFMTRLDAHKIDKGPKSGRNSGPTSG